MKESSLGLMLMLLMVCLCGCSFYWNHGSKTIAWKPEKEPLAYEIKDRKNKFNIGRLEKGMTSEEVYDVMGMPDLYGGFETADETEADVFFYYTQTKVSDGSATGEECTPLVIVDGKLAGWGKEFHDKMNVPPKQSTEVFER